jgi:hypothetical protein
MSVTTERAGEQTTPLTVVLNWLRHSRSEFASLTSGAGVGVNEMSHDRFLLDLLANSRFDIAIAAREAFVLPEVLGP